MGIINRVNKLKKTLDNLSEEQGLSKRKIYFDYAISRIKYGCALNHYLVGNFYKYSSFERRKIFTYKHWNYVVNNFNDTDSIEYLKNKIKFNTLFKDYIGRDWLYSKSMSIEDFKEFCRKNKKAIIKPMDGLEGNGVEMIELPVFKNESEFKNEFLKFKEKDLLIEEVIAQHPQMIFGNSSVNTIRVYTVMNADTVSIIKTVVRAGVGDSIVDNSHSGGCAYEVDKELGYIISPYYAANRKSSFVHPNTDICMLGRKIPFWNEVLSICNDAAKKIPKCQYIGWDVAITENGPLLIEGNHMPDLDMIEFVGSHGFLDKIMKGLGK